LRLAVKYKTDSHGSPDIKIPLLTKPVWKAETRISYNSFGDAKASAKLFGRRLRVGGLSGGFILDGKQLHFEY
jgi:hypothetical protein